MCGFFHSGWVLSWEVGLASHNGVIYSFTSFQSLSLSFCPHHLASKGMWKGKARQISLAISSLKWNFEQISITRENPKRNGGVSRVGYRKKWIAVSIHLKLLPIYSPFGRCHSIGIEGLLLGCICVYTLQKIGLTCLYHHFCGDFSCIVKYTKSRKIYFVNVIK